MPTLEIDKPPLRRSQAPDLLLEQLITERMALLQNRSLAALQTLATSSDARELLLKGQKQVLSRLKSQETAFLFPLLQKLQALQARLEQPPAATALLQAHLEGLEALLKDNAARKMWQRWRALGLGQR